MDTVRIARDLGDVSALLPEGWSLVDAPYTFHDAVRMAIYFLSFDEMLEDDRPPKRIWLDNDAMKAHHQEVKRRWDAKYGKQGGDKEIEGEVSENAASLIVE